MKKFIAGALALTMIAGMACMPTSAEVYDEITTDVMTTDGEQFNAAPKSVEEFLKSGTDLYDATIYDGTGKTGFNTNGRTYYTGVVLKGGSASATFNTKGVKKISFYIAHLDNSSYSDNKLNVYFDGELSNTSYQLQRNMPFTRIDLNVTDYDQVKFALPAYSSGTYAIVDMVVDGLKTKKGHDTPTYKSTDDLFNKMYNTNSLKFYDSTKKIGCMVNGRTYYRGVVMQGGGAFTLNTENISSISFDLGALDNSGYDSNQLTVYYDNEETKHEIKCDFNSPIKRYTLDLKNVDNLRIVGKSYINCDLVLGDIQFNNVKTTKTFTKPTYNDAVDFMKSNYNTSDIEIYDGSKKLGFDMQGTNYKQGIIMNDGSNMTFNVENIGGMKFKLGHVDDTSYASNPIVKVYFDNVLHDEFKLDKNSKPIDVSYDLTGVKNIYFLYKCTYTGQRNALANISISKNAPKATVMKGDANQDKQINVTDIAVIATHIKGIKALTGNGLAAADVNGDKQINVGDIAMIASHIKGIKALK